jgi:peptidoglycan/xylan/chitin deacetylase (PgdA/CDA1 family)
MREPMMFGAATSPKIGRRLTRPLAEATRRMHALAAPGDIRGTVGVILLYHRVVALATDPQLLSVTPERFAEHLEVVRERYAVVRLEDVVGLADQRRPPRRWVAVTLDDGYADALHQARPIMERFDVPATVYVTSGQIGSTAEFWWDDLERLVLIGARPSRLALRLGGRVMDWSLDEATMSGGEDTAWHIEREDDPTPRHRAYRELYGMLHSLGATERNRVVGQLRTWAEASSHGRESHRALSEAELERLAESPLVEIGAHSTSHPQLTALPLQAQKAEIAESRDRLEAIVGRAVRSFAYPHGSYDDQTLGVVRDAGYRSACSSDVGAVRSRSDRFRLPRLAVRDWDGDTFERTLAAWFRLP